jgi:serine/threonine protein kinase
MASGEFNHLTDFLPGSQFQQYKLLEQIGAGGMGMVWSALDEAKNCVVAIKVNELDPDNQSVNYLMLDQHFMGIQHPHVLPTYDFGLLENIQYIVTPYIPGGSLEDRLNTREPLYVEDILKYASEIASALDCLHGEQIIHRDLKPANILINFKDHLCVADFDLARILSKTTQSMHTGRGTPAFAPPEQHSMAEITPQSDIFSLGILLYQMFTRIVPWNGEKSLGIQQLTTPGIEIPDPREIKQDLPEELAIILRKMTAVNPEDRPASAGQVMQMLYSCFKQEAAAYSSDSIINGTELRDLNATELLEKSLAHWEQNPDNVVPTLTKLAVIDLKYRIKNNNLPTQTVCFMLTNALIYGYQDGYWWRKLTDSSEKLAIASQLINKFNDAIAERIIDHLETDRAILSSQKCISTTLVEHLLGRAQKTKSPELREKILSFIPAVTAKQNKWRKNALGGNNDLILAGMAVSGGAASEKAAQLIGHLHSESATLEVFRKTSPAQRESILQFIQMAAGSLPASIPLSLRASITASWFLQNLAARPSNILLAFSLAFLGTFIGTSIQTYFSYRLPGFLDFERTSIALERGSLFGLIFGVGILVTRLIAERLTFLGKLPRIILAAVAGATSLNMGLFTNNVLFLKYVPDGFLLSAGCLFIALGFASASLLQGLPARSAVTTLFISAALAGTWWAHTQLAVSPASLTPIFFYEYTWANTQVFVLILLVAIPMAVLGNLSKLSLDKP